ncbi:anthranilate synthase component I family protein [Actinocorallia sp. A-T 12471]|uniref:anthranilate synthase component I family protein n=1 Tax=Actinocorallia sp. A-T 12471 TaxID=3089813 RepID=UPI0029CB4BA8|nr:anthranilate synthase component I family protein [Actinocorallia sp. A-T 12471]MDX6741582.1 anthranilate synthase component I family protein [Actinocorallia sp. A-T 12471]
MTITGRKIAVTTAVRGLTPGDPLDAYRALAGRFGGAHVHLLESADPEARDEHRAYVGFGLLCAVSVFGSEVRIEGVPEVREAVRTRVAPLLDGDALRTPRDLWDVLRAVHAVFDADGSPDEFRFGFLAHFGYESVQYIEDIPVSGEPVLPDVHLALHEGCVVYDLRAGTAELRTHTSAAWPAADPDEIAALLSARLPPLPEPAVPPATPLADSVTEAEFTARVARSLRHIAVGDVYQIQLGHELRLASAMTPLDAYRRLRARNASPYMYLAEVAGRTLVGASPEMFVRVSGGRATMRPIAGTVPRDGDDAGAAARLRADTKEIAEHTMLVDLCRNDLARVCRPASLEVSGLFAVERYSHVLHLVSTVEADVEPDRDAYDVIAATFPAGTMTGAPKIRAMELIEELEQDRRGLYGGALGLIDVGGHVTMALCIRTLVHEPGVYTTRACAGIVADSVPAREWQETLAKMSAAYWAVTGRELIS